MPGAAGERVVPGPADHGVVAGTAGERLVAGAAVDDVVAAAGVDRVVAAAAADHVVAGGALEHVVARGADGRAARVAGDERLDLNRRGGAVVARCRIGCRGGDRGGVVVLPVCDCDDGDRHAGGGARGEVAEGAGDGLPGQRAGALRGGHAGEQEPGGQGVGDLNPRRRETAAVRDLDHVGERDAHRRRCRVWRASRA